MDLDGKPIGDAYAEHMDEAKGVGVSKVPEGKEPEALPPDYCGSCYGAGAKEDAVRGCAVCWGIVGVGTFLGVMLMSNGTSFVPYHFPCCVVL